MTAREQAVQLVLGSGVFDTEWYEAQAGTTFDDAAEAVRHYLVDGRRAGWSPHPLFVPAQFRPRRWDQDSTDPLVTYLRGAGDAWSAATSPLFDPARLSGTPGPDRSPLVAFLEQDALGAELPLSPGAGWLRDGVTLADVRGALRSEASASGDTENDPSRDCASAPTEQSLVSIVVVDCDTTTDVTAVLGAIDRAVPVDTDDPGPVVEVMLLTPDERQPAIVGLALARLARYTVRKLPVTADHGVSSTIDEAVLRARGEHVVLMSARQVFREGTLRDWLETFAGSGAAALHPVVLRRDLLLRDAGVVYPPHGKDPVPFLTGMHPDSVSWDRRWFQVPGAPAPLLARTESLRAVQGPQRPHGLWADVDLSQRIAAYEGRPVVVARDLVVSCSADSVFDDRTDPADDLARFRDAWRRVPRGSAALYKAFGLAPVFTGQDAFTVPDRPATWVRPLWLPAPPQVDEAPPALHWAIKTAMPADERARQWGDYHFAGSLAAALRDLGQHVVVDYGRNDARETSYRDDVVLMLRGLRAARLPADVTSVVWVISHPDLVTARELAAYDLRYAASRTWSADISARWDLPVRPLLQCTDVSRFYIDDEPVHDVVGKAVMVGNSRGEARPAAVGAVRSGTPLAVYGSRWEPFLPAEVIAGTYVPNEVVRRYYRSAAWALNDHWPDMRSLGFVSNRVFDILASGGRLLTDDVAGLDEIVRPVHPRKGLARFRTTEELHTVLAGGSGAWYDESTLRSLSDHVREQHGFAARAAVLLEDVLGHRTAANSGPGR